MKNKLPLDPKVELFRWGPAPMRLYFNSEFDGIMVNFPKVFPNHAWPDGLLLSKQGKMAWVNEFPELWKRGEKLFLEHLLPLGARQKVWDGWQKDLLAVQDWEEKVRRSNLRDLSNDSFLDLWKEMRNVLMSFWTHGLAPEMGNYGAEKLLERELSKISKDESARLSLMEILTAPEEPSFYQVEEFELYKTRDISEHAKKYFWLKNSYDGTEVLNEDFFKTKKAELKFDPRIEFEKKKLITRKRKDDAINKYKLPKKIVAIGAGIARCVEWQDERKKNIWIYLHYKDLMLNEAAQRLKLPKDDLLNFGTQEILKMLEGRIPEKRIIEDRRIGCVAVMKILKETHFLGSKEALHYWDLYLEHNVDAGVLEIKGTVVSVGKIVNGKVRIVLDPKKADQFKIGEILVAPMTTPEYIFAMKKASAVVTDTGGLTSHAAIVSRELGIPCIVGTKIATKVLKDGDLVEIDTRTGMVRKIK